MYFKATLYSNLGYNWHNLANIHQVYVFLSSSKYIIQQLYAINRVKIHIVKRLTLKHFNLKSYYYFCTNIKIAAYHHPGTISHKNSNSNFFSQIQLAPQHKARLFPLQLLTYCSTIGASCSHISSW